MFSSSILDTAIAVVFVFLLVSLVVTTLNEGVAALFVSRAKWLRIGLNRMLTPEMAEQFYGHALIQGISRPSGFVRRALGRFAGHGPSYVPSRTFAVALLDTIANRDPRVAETRRTLETLLDGTPLNDRGIESLLIGIGKFTDGLDASTPIGARIRADLYALVAELSKPALGPTELVERLMAIGKDADAVLPDGARDALQRLIDTLIGHGERADVVKTGEYIQAIAGAVQGGSRGNDVKLALQKLVTSLQTPRLAPAQAIRYARDFIRSLPDRYARTAISTLTDSSLKSTLLTLLDETQGDIGKLKEAVEIWFNAGMDRVAGWYKRRTSFVVMILAAAVTLALNVDTLLILQTLQSDASLREAIVGKAKTASEGGLGSSASRVTASAPRASLESTPEAGATGADRAGSGIFDDAQMHSLQAQIQSLALPIGWFSASSPADCLTGRNSGTRVECVRAANHQLLPSTQDAATFARSLWESVTFHGLGWLLTIIAASLGAPFWFDTLNKIIAIRSVGKAPEEEQKPPKSAPAPQEPGETPREAATRSAVTRS